MEIQRLISGTFLYKYNNSMSFYIIKVVYLVFSIIYDELPIVNRYLFFFI